MLSDLNRPESLESFTQIMSPLNDEEVLELFDSSMQFEVDDVGATPLVAAIRLGRYSVVEKMLDRGFSPSVRTLSSSAIGAAIDSTSSEGVRILGLLLQRIGMLEEEDPFNFCGELNEPMLHAAIRRRNEGAVQLLLKHGANPEWMCTDCVSARELGFQTEGLATREKGEGGHRGADSQP